MEITFLGVKSPQNLFACTYIFVQFQSHDRNITSLLFSLWLKEIEAQKKFHHRWRPLKRSIIGQSHSTKLPWGRLRQQYLRLFIFFQTKHNSIKFLPIFDWNFFKLLLEQAVLRTTFDNGKNILQDSDSDIKNWLISLIA